MRSRLEGHITSLQGAVARAQRLRRLRRVRLAKTAAQPCGPLGILRVPIAIALSIGLQAPELGAASLSDAQRPFGDLRLERPLPLLGLLSLSLPPISAVARLALRVLSGRDLRRDRGLLMTPLALHCQDSSV
jgi:hypothetical protein